jgi:hypothetical protein
VSENLLASTKNLSLTLQDYSITHNSKKNNQTMSFFTRLSNGWELAKRSFKTINENRTLLLFPILSGFSLVLVLATFFGGTFFFVGDEIEVLLQDDQLGNILGYGLVFLYYLINFSIIVFFNAALVHCAMKALNNEEVSLSDGIQFAFSRIDKILGWAVLSATVGMLLQMLQEAGKIGQIVASLIGVAWSILTFFVVPILVYEDRGVFDTVKESGRLMKEKWGESLAANVSFGIFNFVGILLALLLGYALSSIHPALGIAVGVALVLVITIVISAARTVFVAAVYNHVTGQPTGNFDGAALDSVFVQK